MGNRISQLDSLRGIAALTVLLSHFLTLISGSVIIAMINFTPGHIFWAGHEAVIFFFILSGFVLTLPFLEGKQTNYLSFIVKRFFRIYVPYICAILPAMFLQSTLSRYGIKQLGQWFNAIWMTPLNWTLFLNHLLLITDYENYAFDPVIWSLIHEMRISLIFPFLVMLVLRVDWKISLGIGVLLSIASYKIRLMLWNTPHFMDYGSNYTDTLHYLLMFVCGMLLARHRHQLVTVFQRLKKTTRLFIFVSAVLMYTYTWWFFPENMIIHKWVINDWAISLGATVLLVAALASPVFTAILKLAPIRYLGKISYSLYLCHAVVLLALVNMFYSEIPLKLLLLIAFCVAVLVSSLFHRCIEVPAIKLGATVTRLLNRGKGLASKSTYTN